MSESFTYGSVGGAGYKLRSYGGRGEGPPLPGSGRSRATFRSRKMSEGAFGQLLRLRPAPLRLVVLLRQETARSYL